ncbi:carboxylesterase/lipase family protein [Steroidobacter cummioxidans]|uniref:carboxylesterase/lipase family protein n=1 Tax=Steroidobacter cummioxidans TaxID=1803913 RepID=UPI000E320861|nr:carboxylesterase/lipase family protein [Steroidobacter cummioxidans]
MASGRSISRRELLGSSLLMASSSILPSIVHASSGRSSILSTRAGKVAGVKAQGVHIFKGIPYGADTRTTRFLPPQLPVAWKKTRDALNYGPSCPQPGSHEQMGENCLVLNVWTPALQDGRKRPVMVWFHGGEFSSGSGSSALYDGTRLCQRGDVVVVTVNHRLNVFGHLYLARLAGAQYASSGNVGILDLVQALAWVRDHAAAIGGDPQRIMVFGQSGGGAKIATMMAMPVAQGSFQRAATMSGQQVTAAGPRGATQRALTILETLKIAPTDVAKLGDVPAGDLVAATRANDPSMVGRNIYFGPVLDQSALLRHPFYPDAPPLAAGIPMIIGNTLDETRAFLGNEPGVHELTWEGLPERLLPQLHVDIQPEYVIAEYRKLYPKYSATEVFFAATTAGRSWRGAVIEAELRASQGSPAYAYQLNYRSPLENGRFGAMHGMDIPLVFDNIAQPGSPSGTDADTQKAADQMSEAFIAFARTGNPTHAGIPEWKPYELSSRATMVFDVKSQLVNDPRGEERKLFAQVPYIQRGTY